MKYAALIVLLALMPGAWAGEFRVLPYQLNPRPDGIMLVWFSEANAPGQVVIGGESLPAAQQYDSTPETLPTLAYFPPEKPDGRHATEPFRHVVQVTGLPEAAAGYTWSVTQNGETSRGTFRTAPRPGTMPGPVRIVAFADSETEPESTGKKTPWPAAPGVTRPGGVGNDYLVDQTEGFRANLAGIAARNPDLVLLAGDLVESGGEQRDWDEFWRHMAGPYAHFLGDRPLVPAIGNHENYGGPGSLGGYRISAAIRSINKYKTYFPQLPENGASDPRHEGRYYRQDLGRVTILTLDSSDGGAEHQGTEQDTSWPLDGTDSNLGIPDFNPPGEQWRWVERELRAAGREGRLVIPQFHHAPYSSGVHGTVPGNGDDQSGMPMRVYSPLFEKFRVRLVISGHDEMLEMSVVNGVMYWDVGIAGDGLREHASDEFNPYRQWLAHTNAPEAWNGARLVKGGKHYGYLEIDVAPAATGPNLQLSVAPVMNFPLTDAAGALTGAYERREYFPPASTSFVPFPYAQWRLAKFSETQRVDETVGGDLADSDGDGLTALAEYALNTNPLADDAWAPVIRRSTVEVGGAKYLALEMNRNPAATDLGYIVEISDDLVNWTSTGLVVVEDTPERLVVREAEPLGDRPRKHLRARIQWLP
jgi:hypothetical protein